MRRCVRLCIERAWVAPILAQEIDRSFSRLGEVLGGCERIRSTPIPFSYSVLLHRTVYVYCYLLPFGLIDTIGNFTPLVVGERKAVPKPAPLSCSFTRFSSASSYCRTASLRERTPRSVFSEKLPKLRFR